MDAPRTEAVANGHFFLDGEEYRFDMSMESLRATPFGQRFETASSDDIISDLAPLIEPGRAFVDQTFGLIQTCRTGRWTPVTLDGDGAFGLALQKMQPGEHLVIRTAFFRGLAAFFTDLPLWADAENTQELGLVVAAAIDSMFENAQAFAQRTQAAVRSRLRQEVESTIADQVKQIEEMPLVSEPQPVDTPPSRGSMITDD